MTTATTSRQLLDQFRTVRPRTRGELSAWVRAFCGLKIPARRLCPEHDSPLDYLAASFLAVSPLRERGVLDVSPLRQRGVPDVSPLRERGVGDPGLTSGTNTVTERPPDLPFAFYDSRCNDLLIWANRGGGKTQLGAIASLLDAVFLPGCQACILGGSEDQSQRMYDYLRVLLGREFADRLDGPITQRLTRLSNGSTIASLAQSDRSVRGHHPQRLRCDELELFDRDVWEAAQFLPQAQRGIPARLEVFSTQHRPWGLMSELLAQAPRRGMRVFRWCLWEVIEPCRGRTCSQCPLWEDCQGRAQNADGYLSIDDAIAYKLRSSRARWQAEMLCRRPQAEDLVFPEFQRTLHVAEIAYDAHLPLYRAIDFGFTNPLVCLFIQMDAQGVVRVLDEHVLSRATLQQQARLIREKYPQPVQATYADPAGSQSCEITGTSAMTEMAGLGIPIQWRFSRILDGLELMRDYLAPADGRPKLLLSPRCRQLITAFERYHYARDSRGQLAERPEKDGVHDHPLDALRYFFINRLGRGSLKKCRY